MSQPFGRVAFSKAEKSDFVSSTHGSHHIHLIDRIAKLFNNFRLEEKATSTSHLPELKDMIPSGEHFGLVTSSFASTYGGLLDIKTEDSDSPVVRPVCVGQDTNMIEKERGEHTGLQCPIVGPMIFAANVSAQS
jgi:hypothetical protein